MDSIRGRTYFMEFEVEFVDREQNVTRDCSVVDNVFRSSELKRFKPGIMSIGKHEIRFNSFDNKAYSFNTHLIRKVCVGKIYELGFGLLVEKQDQSYSCYVFTAKNPVFTNGIVHYCRLLIPIKWQEHSTFASGDRNNSSSNYSIANCSDFTAKSINSAATVQKQELPSNGLNSISSIHLSSNPQNFNSFGVSTGFSNHRFAERGCSFVERRLTESGIARQNSTNLLPSLVLPKRNQKPTERTTNDWHWKGKKRRSIASTTTTNSSRLFKVLNHRQSLGHIQKEALSVSRGKENIAPQSMPDTAADSGKVDLEKLLKSESAHLEGFKSFLQQQFCIENLNFYLAVEEYKVITDEQKRRELGRQIYERHFTPNSIEPVNIDNATCKGIMESIHTENYSQDMYNLAQYQIYHLLKYDVYPRFLQNATCGKTPGELASDSKKGPCTSSSSGRKGNSSTTSSARSTNSTQLASGTEKTREKRKSFFRFLRRNNKELSQENASPTCSITAVPCTSKQQTSGVYGEELCSSSAGELRKSLSPTATKRRMTRERSVPATSSRSGSATSTMIIGQSDENTGHLGSTTVISRTRAMSSRENNSTSPESLMTQKIPSVCIVSPESTAQPDSPLPSTSQQKTITSTATGIKAQKLEEANSRTSSITTISTVTSATAPPDPTTSLLHDEKELSSRFSVAVTQQGKLTEGTSSNNSNNDFQPNSSRFGLPVLFSSTVGSDKEPPAKPSDSLEAGFQWQKADYV